MHHSVQRCRVPRPSQPACRAPSGGRRHRGGRHDRHPEAGPLSHRILASTQAIRPFLSASVFPVFSCFFCVSSVAPLAVAQRTTGDSIRPASKYRTAERAENVESRWVLFLRCISKRTNKQLSPLSECSAMSVLSLVFTGNRQPTHTATDRALQQDDDWRDPAKQIRWQLVVFLFALRHRREELLVVLRLRHLREQQLHRFDR